MFRVRKMIIRDFVARRRRRRLLSSALRKSLFQLWKTRWFDRPRQSRGVWWTTNTNQTFNPRTGGAFGALDVPITANRTFTLSTTGAFEGQEVTIYRTVNATGAFTFTGGGATLSNPGESARFVFRNGAWVFMAKGA